MINYLRNNYSTKLASFVGRAPSKDHNSKANKNTLVHHSTIRNACNKLRNNQITKELRTQDESCTVTLLA